MGADYLSAVFDSLTRWVGLGIILLCIFVPLGLWKLVEIVIWLFKNVNISIGG